MRKILTIIVTAAVAFGLVGCQKDELVKYQGNENATVPGLSSSLESVLLTEDGVLDDIAFTKSDYGISCAVSHSLFFATDAEFSNEKKIASLQDKNAKVFSGIKMKDLNMKLLGLGVPKETEVDVYLRVKSSMMSESDVVKNTELVSEAIQMKMTTYDAEQIYDRVWLPGSANGWNHANALHLFNYNGDGSTYVGVACFLNDVQTSLVENEFKVTGSAGWDNGNWGVADKEAEAESDKLQLLEGSNDNITQYRESKYYIFSFNKKELVLTKKLDFDKVGIIGINDAWGEEDDIVMKQDPYRQVFYADVEGAKAGTTFKFRFDGGWDVNLGGNLDKLSAGGDNIKIEEEGNYRIFLDINDWENPTARIDANEYGKELSDPYGEGGGEEPEEPTEMWSVIGLGGDWNTDIDMIKLSSNIWLSPVMQMSGEFKLRYNHSWDEDNRGIAEGKLLVGTPSDVKKDGANFNVSEGLYQISYNASLETITLLDAKDAWSAVGLIESSEWNLDVVLAPVAEGVYESPIFKPNGDFKLRKSQGWDVNRGIAEGTTMDPGKAFEVVQGGGNIGLFKDCFIKLVYDSNAETLTVNYAWGIIGNNGDWDNDHFMTETSTGIWETKAVLTSDFKLRLNGKWDVNRGGVFSEFGKAFEVKDGGDNIKLPEADKPCHILYNAKDETMTISEIAE